MIEPNEIDQLLIQQGRGLLTLFICHPYPQDIQRYGVFCQRKGKKEAARLALGAAPFTPTQKSWPTLYGGAKLFCIWYIPACRAKTAVFLQDAS